MRASIRSVEYYLPEAVLSSARLVEDFPDWSAEKIEAKTGIRERRIAGDGECSSDLAVAAARKPRERWMHLWCNNPVYRTVAGWPIGWVLEWHYRSFLESGDAWILAARTGSRLAAYAVFERKDARSAGLNRVLLVDFQMLEPDPALASAMLRAAIERCRAENIPVLENVGCWMERVEMARTHPTRHRALKSWCYLYKAADPELAEALENPACWYPTQYDGDASL